MGHYIDSNRHIGMYVLFAITLTIAAASIIYELLLGQTLSAFLGNTIQQYSITIGLYMFSMGLGSFIMEKKLIANPLRSLLWVEIVLALIGGFVIIGAHILHALIPSVLLFVGTLYLLIVAIGFLTGMEIPLLFELGKAYKADLENIILGVDYTGAFFGSILFAFFFYTVVGLTATAFIIALFNALAGIALYTQRAQNKAKKIFFIQIAILCMIVVLMSVLLVNATHINESLVQLYVS